jgi:glycosyltransferase involved in cell wall biosynthesis
MGQSEKMKILVISYHYSFSENTGSLRSRAMVKYLPKNGIEVAVLSYRAQRDAVSFTDDMVGVKDVNRDTVPLPVYYAWRIRQYGLRALGFHRGVQEYWRDAALTHADEIMERIHPDAILASYPSAEAFEIGVALAERYGLPLISDFRDGLLFEPIETTALQRNATRHYYEALEARVVAASRLILTVSEPISNYFRERYAHRNVMTLHNGFDPNDIVVDVNAELPTDVINVVHTGRLDLSRLDTSGKGRAVDGLGAALRMLLERSPEMARKVQVHFVGQLTTAEISRLEPLAGQGIVKLWGHMPRARALGFQRKADILLLITAPDKASIATGKIFEYLAANKPILALTRGTEAERIVKDTGAGVVVAPDRPEEIAKAIEGMIRHDSVLFEGRNEISISAFSRDRQMEVLASRLMTL